MKPGALDKSGGKSAQTLKGAKPQESDARKRLAQLEAEMEREKQEKRRRDIMAQQLAKIKAEIGDSEDSDDEEFEREEEK